MRLIDADALIDKWEHDIGIFLARDIVISIEDAPTIDAVPVRHGEWKEWDDGDNTWSCSVCGNPFVLIDGTPSDNEMNYCPNCGARMDGGKE